MQRAGVIAGVLLLAFVFTLIFTSLSGHKVVWLTPDELVQRTQPGPFSGIKQKVRTLVMPVWKHFRRTPPQVRIDMSVLKVTEAGWESGLGPPVTTDASGIRAWILSPTNASAFRMRLKTPAVSMETAPRAQTYSDGQMRLQSVELRNVAGKPTPVGFFASLFPKVVSRSVKLTMDVTFTELTTPPPGRIPTIETNIAALCQTVIPNGGCLVLAAEPQTNADRKSYWMMVSPMVIPKAGKP